MRHRKSGRPLSRTSSHRQAMFRNMSASLLRHELIRTTVPKAKELRRVVEPLITLAKTDSVAKRRLVFSRLRDREMVDDTKGYTDELWKKMAELGFMGFLFPEQFGGTGGSFLDMAVLLYEMGYANLPGPFFSTAVLGGMTLLEAGTDQQEVFDQMRVSS